MKEPDNHVVGELEQTTANGVSRVVGESRACRQVGVCHCVARGIERGVCAFGRNLQSGRVASWMATDAHDVALR